MRVRMGAAEWSPLLTGSVLFQPHLTLLCPLLKSVVRPLLGLRSGPWLMPRPIAQDLRISPSLSQYRFL